MSKKEIWKSVPGWEDYFQISSKGRLRKVRFSSTGRIIKTTIYAKHKHGIYLLLRPCYKRTYQAVTLVRNAFFPTFLKNKYFFKDGDRLNCSIDNIVHTEVKGVRSDAVILNKTEGANTCYMSIPRERWKDIEGLEGRFQASSQGRIRSVRIGEAGKRVPVHIMTLSKLNPKSKNLSVYLHDGKKSVGFIVADLIHDTFYPKLKGRKYKLKDGNSFNLKSSNIITLKGPRRIDAKFKKSVISRLRSGESVKDICIKLGVSDQSIRNIKKSMKK